VIAFARGNAPPQPRAHGRQEREAQSRYAFDVPVVGIKTIDVMRAAGGTCLALDAVQMPAPRRKTECEMPQPSPKHPSSPTAAPAPH